MYDINFFKNSFKLKKNITSGGKNKSEVSDIFAELEYLRDKKPYIYNIETTNYCNMKCVMCPRTQFMTRKNIWIDDSLFEKMTDNVRVHDDRSVDNFWEWLSSDYKFDKNEVSENGFYFQ